jgi:hypothetical protein
MSLDLRTISTDEADRKLALRAEAYQAGNATNLDEQVADYIRQVEEVLEVRGVNRLEWLKEVRDKVRLRLARKPTSAPEDRVKPATLSAQRRTDYFAAVEAQLRHLIEAAEG